MKYIGKLTALILLGTMPALTGCNTVSKPKPTVVVNKGSYQQADGAVGNDIKNLLAQGGLNTANPSAAPAGSQAMTASTGNDLKVISTTATDLKTLVAQLDASPAKPATSAVQAPPTQQTQTNALALAEPAKAAQQPQEQIITDTKTTVFQPIGTPGELIPIMPPLPETAEAPKPKKTLLKKRPAQMASGESSYKKPSVKRF